MRRYTNQQLDRAVQGIGYELDRALIRLADLETAMVHLDQVRIRAGHLLQTMERELAARTVRVDG